MPSGLCRCCGVNKVDPLLVCNSHPLPGEQHGMCYDCAMKLPRIHCIVCLEGDRCAPHDIWRNVYAKWVALGSLGTAPREPQRDDQLLPDDTAGGPLSLAHTHTRARTLIAHTHTDTHTHPRTHTRRG
jgi:hypothetical protein